VGDSGRQILVRQYLDRIINNTFDGIFFIPKYSAEGVEEHLAAFLHLSAALRRDHFDVCLGAKVAQMEEILAAKVGALLGDLYNRIDTPDLHETAQSEQIVADFKEEFYDEMGLSHIGWLTDEQIRRLKKAVKSELRTTQEDVVRSDRAGEFLVDLPAEREALAERAIEVLRKRCLMSSDDSKLDEGKQFLVNDPTFQRLTRR
jgi:hypothetical protein